MEYHCIFFTAYLLTSIDDIIVSTTISIENRPVATSTAERKPFVNPYSCIYLQFKTELI